MTTETKPAADNNVELFPRFQLFHDRAAYTLRDNQSGTDYPFYSRDRAIEAIDYIRTESRELGGVVSYDGSPSAIDAFEVTGMALVTVAA